MTHVKAAVVREKSGPFTISELELSAPRSDEVLVRIVGADICHTDLVCRDQYFPVPLPCVLGHEGSGIVEQVGSDVAGLAPGDHVVLSYASCGVCSSCLQGLPGFCLDLYRTIFWERARTDRPRSARMVIPSMDISSRRVHLPPARLLTHATP